MLYLNCGLNPELMFSVNPADEARAKAVCADCPVREACLAYAINTGEDFGVWGGTTPDERRALRRHELEKRLITAA